VPPRECERRVRSDELGPSLPRPADAERPDEGPPPHDGVDPERPLERDRRRRDLRELHSLRDEPDLRPGGEQHVRGRWQVEPDRVHVPPDGTTIIGNATSLNTTAPTHPRLYTRDRVFFDDDFTRIGRFEWATNVTVDGKAAMMTFNIQGGGPLTFAHAGAYFVGFWLRAA